MITNILKKICLATVLVFILPCLLYAGHEEHRKLSVGKTDQVYQLTGKWKFRGNNNLDYALPDYDDSGWQLISVPGQWHIIGIKDVETAWYRRSIYITKDFNKTPISIQVPVIADAHELYFNGKKIGEAGIIATNGKIVKKSSRPGIYRIPADIINYKGKNLIALRVCDDVGWGGIVTSSFFIGSSKILTQRFQRNLMWNASISLLLVFLGVYYLILFLSRLKEIVYFYYFLLSTVAGLTLFGSTSFTYIVVDNFWVNHFVFHSGLNILPLFAFFFAYNYFEFELDLVYKFFTKTYIILFAVLLMTPLHLSILRFYGKFTLTVSIVLDLAAIVFMMIIVIKSVKLKKLGAEAICIGASLLVLAVTNDILGYLNILHTKRLMAEGLILFTISMSVAMALKYAKLYDALQAAQKELVEKEKMEHEIKLAANVQRSLLPVNLPEDANFSVDAYLEPARMVGGDFYDVIRIDNEHLGLLVADVADKGIHAAMSMAVTRTLFFTESRRSISPAQVANAVHKYIMDVMPTNDIFVTAFYGVLHCPTGLLTYVRAGHEKPMLFRPGQPVNALVSNGRFLGMIDQLDIEEYTFQLQPGDRLIIYSDGVTDATNLSGDMFGNSRFMECLEKNGSLPAAKLVRQIIDTTSAWSQGATQFDDLTLLVVEAK